MTEKYLSMNNEVFIFHPDTHEVFRAEPGCIERLDHTRTLNTLRLKAMEITRQQAMRAVPYLRQLQRQEN